MSDAVRNLEPQSLWSSFADINAIPRASKKEEQIIAFMLEFGKSLNLDTHKDHIGNVIIKKPATPGMENRQTVVLQSHLDMVHQKNNDTQFDFETEGIKMYVDGDWVKAEGTTLGADNGIGVAAIMALLRSTDIPHPALEALFTIDEETGMTGALELKGGLLNGDIMLNLDTEEDNELTIGCAGGIDISISGTYELVMNAEERPTFTLTVKGATGGHSGMDIHKGRANANKLMNRMLFELNEHSGIHVNSIDGGGLRNAIPRESVSIIAVEDSKKDDLSKHFDKIRTHILDEYKTTDPQLEITLSATDPVMDLMSPKDLSLVLGAIYACPNGIYRMSPDIPSLVQTSNNLARVSVKGGKFEILCLTRSSVESEKLDLVNAITACFANIGALVSTGGSYPGWQPKPDAEIVKTMSEIYKQRFGEPANVNACHAGLECGILGQNYPDMDMISFGPNIHGAHSPDERVQISSVQKFWGFLLETLEKIPVSN